MSSTISHKDAPLGYMHPIINWTFATVEDLNTFNGIVAKDFHKVAYVEEVEAYFTPISIDAGSGEVTWLSLGGGGSGTGTNLTVVPSALNVAINSSTGTDAIFPAATALFAGAMLPEHVSKLASYPANTTFFEAVTDTCASMMAAGDNITLTYDDFTNVLTISASGGGSSVPTNLSAVYTAVDITVVSSTGTDAVLVPATNLAAGLMTPTQVEKLSTFPSGTPFPEAVQDVVAGLIVAGTNITVTYNDTMNTLEIATSASIGVTNLGYIGDPTNGTVTSNTGTDAVIPLGTTVNAGLIAPAQTTKLDGINIGTAGADVPNNTQLNIRLGTSGNLGTMAQQNANDVAVIGGTISGITSVDINGDITLNGSARRIRADFSNSTISNRAAYQTSVLNGGTNLNVIPNGTSAVAQLLAFNSADANNASLVAVSATASAIRLQSGQSGTGVYLPLEIITGGAAQAVVTAAGNVGFGVATPTSHKIEVSGRAYASGGFVYPTFLKTTVPSASANTNAGVIVTDAAGAGRRPFWSDGTNWRDAANVILS